MPSEAFLILTMIFLICVGLVMLHSAPDRYRLYVAEDGPVEWISTICLLNGAFICLSRVIRLRGRRKTKFIAFSFLAALAFLFAVGEELSWGQRILNIKSSEFFTEHNWQEETNIHNLCFDGLNVNKLVFGTIMGAMISFYLLVMPVLYHKIKRVRCFTDNLGIPIPRVYHAVLLVAISVLVSLINGPDKWELMELAGSMLFLAIFVNPVNTEIFRPHR